MADTGTAGSDSGLLPRTYFRAPRVPLDLRALFLAIVGYGVFRAGSWVLTKICDGTSPVSTFIDEMLKVIQIPYINEEFRGFVQSTFLGGEHLPTGGFWIGLLGGAFVFAVWGFFGQAIHRITALRIARDEGMPLKDALAFAAKNFTTILLCPVIVGLAIAFFYGCNALAGLAISIPFLGEILSIILLPLATISTLVLLLIAIGGAVGMPLVAAAAAWERNGSLDAISRAFSYVFARPLQFFWNYFLIFLFTTVILMAGFHFSNLLASSVDKGLIPEKASMIIATPEHGSPTYDKYDNETKTAYGKLDEKTKGEHPFVMSLSSLSETPASQWATVLVFWAILNLVKFGTLAAALWWFFGATTSTYADLRSDVDGTEEDEIYLEEEEQDFEALAKAPDTSAPPAPAAAPSTPPTTPPAPPA